MSKSHLFPYGITLKESGAVELFPAAEVGFLNKEKEWLSLFLIIDSGATISALPKSDAEMLGIDIERGTPIIIGGIGGEEINSWQHEIKVRLEDEIIQIPFVFLDTDVAPRVLGRAGIFERFAVIFDERRRKTGFLSYGGEKEKSLRKIMGII